MSDRRLFKSGLWMPALCLVLATVFSSPSLATSDDELSVSYVSSTLWRSVNDVAVSVGYAYCAMGYGLKVLDLGDPADPIPVADLHLEGEQAVGIALSGDYAFVVCGTNGLYVVDIADPTNPSVVGTYDTPGSAVAVAISGNYAYIADSDSGLQVVDVSVNWELRIEA